MGQAWRAAAAQADSQPERQDLCGGLGDAVPPPGLRVGGQEPGRRARTLRRWDSAAPAWPSEVAGGGRAGLRGRQRPLLVPCGFPEALEGGPRTRVRPSESFSRGRRVGSRPEAEHLFPWLPTVAVTASS